MSGSFHLKMKCLHHPLILLLTVSSLASSRLVADFHTGCPQFFLQTPRGHITPTILQGQRYRRICQVYLKADRFATLYDTVNKIPVYSAYLHVPHVQIERVDHWRTEPRLDHNQQADNRDYAGSGMQKGHLYPAYNNNNPEGVNATFTLTNAAPQDSSFNKKWFRYAERPVNQRIPKDCRGNRAYIVTGVVPDPNQIINNRVRVAAYYWTAFCCLDNNGVPLARGVYLMHRSGDELLNQNHNVRDLENQLNIYYNTPFSVFGGRC